MKGDRERCLAAGMDDYVSKPLQPDTLLRMIESFLPPAKAQPAPAVTPVVAPAAPAMAAAAAPLDLGPLLQRCRGNHEFAGKLLEKFRTQSVEVLDGLVRGLKDGDGELATRSAHTLKGMAATVSAEPLRAAAADAEERSRAGDWDAVQRQLDALRAEVDRCVAFIPQVMPGAPRRPCQGASTPTGGQPCAF